MYQKIHILRKLISLFVCTAAIEQQIAIIIFEKKRLVVKVMTLAVCPVLLKQIYVTSLSISLWE